MVQCAATNTTGKRAGKRCGGHAQIGMLYCFSHRNTVPEDTEDAPKQTRAVVAATPHIKQKQASGAAAKQASEGGGGYFTRSKNKNRIVPSDQSVRDPTLDWTHAERVEDTATSTSTASSTIGSRVNKVQRKTDGNLVVTHKSKPKKANELQRKTFKIEVPMELSVSDISEELEEGFDAVDYLGTQVATDTADVEYANETFEEYPVEEGEIEEYHVSDDEDASQLSLSTITPPSSPGRLPQSLALPVWRHEGMTNNEESKGEVQHHAEEDCDDGSAVYNYHDMLFSGADDVPIGVPGVNGTSPPRSPTGSSSSSSSETTVDPPLPQGGGPTPSSPQGGGGVATNDKVTGAACVIAARTKELTDKLMQSLMNERDMIIKNKEKNEIINQLLDELEDCESQLSECRSNEKNKQQLNQVRNELDYVRTLLDEYAKKAEAVDSENKALTRQYYQLDEHVLQRLQERRKGKTIGGGH
jgi:hypothetical protein